MPIQPEVNWYPYSQQRPINAHATRGKLVSIQSTDKLMPMHGAVRDKLLPHSKQRPINAHA